MPKVAGDPLTKVTLNLLAEDVDWLRSYYSQGWTERVREVVSQHVQDRKLAWRNDEQRD